MDMRTYIGIYLVHTIRLLNTFLFLVFITFQLIQDENRYNAGRGAHLTLKRAEKARALVNKLPGKRLLASNITKSLFYKFIFYEHDMEVKFLRTLMSYEVLSCKRKPKGLEVF